MPFEPVWRGDSGRRHEDRIRHSLAAVRRGADLSDELRIGMSRIQGCREFATFETTVAKRHTEFTFVPKE